MGARRPDDRRRVRDTVHRPRVDQRRHDGEDAPSAHGGSIHEPRPRRVGGGQSQPRVGNRGASRSSRRSCWRAARSRFFGPTASPGRAFRSSRGVGRRLPRIGFWRRRTSCPPPAPRAGGVLQRNPLSRNRADMPAAPSKAPTAATDGTSFAGHGENTSRVAGLSRTGTRQQRSWRAHRDRLVRVAAGPDVAPADRAGLVVLRGPRRPPLHPGATRRRRGRRLLRHDHGRAGVASPRRGPFL